MHIKNKRGQSTVEYILLLTTVLVVVIAFLSNSNNSGFQAQLCAVLNQSAADMNTMSGVLTDSHAASSAPSGTAGTPPSALGVNLETGH